MKIEIKNLTKEFKDNIILDDINVTFLEGNIYGIVGRNGTGKSVFFKVLSGLYKADSGSIRFDDLDIIKKNIFPPDTRVLIEKPGFIPNISGLENLKMLANINSKITEEEIVNFFELVDLKKDMNKKYGKYSLGMKQKIGIIQVIMENPKVMIFDEPFSSIDVESSKKIREYLKSIKKDKIIIIATHIKEDIDCLADITYQMQDGKLTNYYS